MKKEYQVYDEKMQKTIGVMEKGFAAIRAGRANPKVLDKITVDYYGTPTPIQQMAAVSVPEGRMLQIQPWDASTLRDIEKAIQYPNSAKDANGRLLAGAAVGIAANTMERIESLYSAKVDIIAIDTAHGHSKNVIEMVKKVKLDEICRQQQVNDGCFASIDKVPTHAMTLTVPTLVRAPYLFCIVPAKWLVGF